MEDGAPIVFGDLNKNICQECGLPLKVYSYDIINKNADDEKINIKLFCPNKEHKTIIDFNFEDYKILIKEYLDKICKCFYCKSILQNTTETPYYCYTCKKIICSNCLNNKHETEHKDIFKYEELQNKCLIHSDRNEIKFYCLICKCNMCINCIVEDLDHTKQHNINKIEDLKNDISINERIKSIQLEKDINKKKKENLIKQLNNLNKKIDFNEFLLKKNNNYHLFYDYNINKINEFNSELSDNSQIKYYVNKINNYQPKNINNKKDINQINNISNNNYQINNNKNNISNDYQINNDNNNNNPNNHIQNKNLNNNLSNEFNNNISYINKNISNDKNNNINNDINNINNNIKNYLKNNLSNNFKNNINNNFINNINNNNISNNLMGNNIINNQINNNININLNNILNINKKKNGINIIYHDENIKFQGMDIVNDCQRIQKQTKSTLILSNDLINLEMLLKTLIKQNIKSKFILLINGSSADKTISFIKNNNYSSFFINCCIYTSNLQKYSSIKEKHSDFIKEICIDCESIINFINKAFQQLKEYNEQIFINNIINWNSYRYEYINLHKELSKFYGDESENSFSLNFSIINNIISNEDFPIEIKENLLKCFKTFSELNKKDYEKIIICYLKDDNFSKFLNQSLIKKDILIYKKIGYFVGNLMYSLVEYGKNCQKTIKSKNKFYRGLQLNIIDVLELLKNRNFIITFPNFVSMVTNKDFVEISSKRNISKDERKAKRFYSVIMTINYLYKDGYESCIIDLNDLAQYPDEKEYILLPFTFLKLYKIQIDSNKYIADIELEIIGKKEILEYKIKENKEILFDKKENIIYTK